MKQNITIEQLNELSDLGKKRLWSLYPKGTLLSVGQLIELLDIDHWERSFKHNELCDALWERAKELLDETYGVPYKDRLIKDRHIPQYWGKFHKFKLDDEDLKLLTKHGLKRYNKYVKDKWKSDTFFFLLSNKHIPIADEAIEGVYNCDDYLNDLWLVAVEILNGDYKL